MEDKLKEILKKIKLNENLISTALGVITIVILVILAVNFWKTNQPHINWFKGEETEEVKEEPKKEEKAEEVTKEKEKVYIVKKGDYLWKIAQEVYGSGYNWVDIAKANKLENPGVLYRGQKLKLPKVEKKVLTNKSNPKVKVTTDKVIKGDHYKVQKGDNLWQIAVRAYQDGYKWVEIAKANKLKNPNVIEVGQNLVIPRK